MNSTDITYSRVETEVCDYRTGSKRKEQDMYVMLSKKLFEDKMELELLTSKGIINCTSKIKGKDKLDIITILDDDSNTIMSETRAFNTDYKESVSRRVISDGGVIVDGVQVEINNQIVAIKTVREESSRSVLAVVTEIATPISEEEYLEKKRLFS